MKKQVYGIVGYPVKHSFSPAMQNAAFRHLKIDVEYRLFEVPPSDLNDFLNRVKSEKSPSGLNVTIPHKIAVREYIKRNGSLNAHAEKLGAVNTIKISVDGSLRGFNTDGPGFYRSLVEDLRFEPEGKDILVLGAGGAARAIVMYLGNGPKKISVFDVEKKRSLELKERYSKYFNKEKFNLVSNAEKVGDVLRDSALLINATPVGMKESDPSPVAKELLRPGLCVYDLVYNRPYTRLIRDANSMKAHAVSGIGMLLYQGAAAFEIWTGEKAPVAVMRRELQKALKAQNK